jgi:hypothetical protein
VARLIYSNGVMGASGYGARAIKVETISYGLSIEGSSAKGRFSPVFSLNLVTQPGFSIGLVFSTHGEYQAFFDWISTYGTKAAHNVGSTGPMRVIVPSRRFDQVGIPKEGITFGDEVHSVVYRQNLNFVGTRGHLSPAQIRKTVSKYIGPTKSNDAPFFYPGGIQLSGAQSDDALYGGTGTGTDPFDPNDRDGDGIPDTIDKDGGTGASNPSTTTDHDGDGIPNFVDATPNG